jgi:hypothetical protein
MEENPATAYPAPGPTGARRWPSGVSSGHTFERTASDRRSRRTGGRDMMCVSGPEPTWFWSAALIWSDQLWQVDVLAGPDAGRSPRMSICPRRSHRPRDVGPERARLAAQRPNVLPKSPLGTAIGYASNNWGALTRYPERGLLALDNNLPEGTLRAIAPGRNARGVTGSDAGGRTAAVLNSVTGTCRHLGIDPFADLRAALPGVFALGGSPHAGQLLDALSGRWQLSRTRDRPTRGRNRA